MEDITKKMDYFYVKKIMKTNIYQYVVDVMTKLDQLVMLKKQYVLVKKDFMLNVSVVSYNIM